MIGIFLIWIIKGFSGVYVCDMELFLIKGFIGIYFDKKIFCKVFYIIVVYLICNFSFVCIVFFIFN